MRFTTLRIVVSSLIKINTCVIFIQSLDKDFSVWSGHSCLLHERPGEGKPRIARQSVCRPALGRYLLAVGTAPPVALGSHRWRRK